ncbi:MAG TPA: glutamate mutase L [Nocardioidaceae bacterium]|nr:glutamate mutase L [Nocardioidaceae bacterium]
MTARGQRLVACVDFGSTFTKAALVDLDTGELVASANHRTTIDTDVLDGWDACLQQLSAVEPRATAADVLACSSAGGGLRIAVIGNEELVTAEAGRRVALSSGGRVVHVASGGLTAAALAEVRASEPDVLLLVGGTDGGNAEVLLGCAHALAEGRWPEPVVVAGNVEAQDEVADLLGAAGTPYVLADNVVPQIGVLAPDSARAAIREMFLRHVIGGKHLSRRADFTAMVRGATPDVVLTAVELLAHGLDAERPGAGDVVVVDVGGATTDVHSVVEIDPEDAGLARQVVATVPVTRTVEGDLGMRWSAISTVEEGLVSDVLPAEQAESLRKAAQVRRTDPSFLPGNPEESEEDELIASAAIAVALRRHAGRQQVSFGPDGRVLERTGKDLREVDVLVGSGGVLRNNSDVVTDRVLSRVTGEVPGGWQLPRAPRLVVDRDYVLAPAGLLAGKHPEAALRLLQTLLQG